MQNIGNLNIYLKEGFFFKTYYILTSDEIKIKINKEAYDYIKSSNMSNFYNNELTNRIRFLKSKKFQSNDEFMVIKEEIEYLKRELELNQNYWGEYNE